jgi:predicted nucleic acid-binding protein
LLSAIRDKTTYATVAALRKASVVWLEMSEADVCRALELQALLVERGEFGVPWTTLMVAAVAERHNVTVLHASHCFDVIAGSVRVGVERVVSRGRLG